MLFERKIIYIYINVCQSSPIPDPHFSSHQKSLQKHFKKHDWQQTLSIVCITAVGFRSSDIAFSYAVPLYVGPEIKNPTQYAVLKTAKMASK